MKEYIERDSLIAWVANNVKILNYARYIISVLSDKERFPAADVEPVRHGEWIEYTGYPHIIVCSECDWGTLPCEKDFKYCPNCGAKMDGGKK